MTLSKYFQKFVCVYNQQNKEAHHFDDNFNAALKNLESFNWNAELLSIEIKTSGGGSPSLSVFEHKKLSDTLEKVANLESKRNLTNEQKLQIFIEYQERTVPHEVERLRAAYDELCQNSFNVLPHNS